MCFRLCVPEFRNQTAHRRDGRRWRVADENEKKIDRIYKIEKIVGCAQILFQPLCDLCGSCHGLNAGEWKLVKWGCVNKVRHLPSEYPDSPHQAYERYD